MIKVLTIDVDKCTGCRMCEMVCSLRKTNTCNPVRSRINVVRWDEEAIVIPVMCLHCQEPPCALVCPTNAIRRNKETGVVITDENLCIGCRMCIVACPFGGPSLDPIETKVIRCDLCQDEEGGPLCAQMCPTEALKFVRADRLGLIERRKAMEKLSTLTKQRLETLVGGS